MSACTLVRTRYLSRRRLLPSRLHLLRATQGISRPGPDVLEVAPNLRQRGEKHSISPSLFTFLNYSFSWKGWVGRHLTSSVLATAFLHSLSTEAVTVVSFNHADRNVGLSSSRSLLEVLASAIQLSRKLYK